MAGAGLGRLVGVRARLKEKGGCLCTINPNKAIVVRAHPEEQRGHLAGRE